MKSSYSSKIAFSQIVVSVFVCVFVFREYLDNIGLVDTGVAELVSIVEDFFDYDGRTAYVFTSDHGMTNWGKTLHQITLNQQVNSVESLCIEVYGCFHLCVLSCVCRFPWCRPSL